MEPVITSADGARRNPAAATCTRRTTAGWRRLMGAWGPVVAGGAAVVVARRLPEVAADARGLLGHGLRLPWLGAAAGFAVAAVAAGVVIQRQLTAAAGARLPGRSVTAVLLASTGLARLPPAGPATAAAWQAGPYRRPGAGGTAAVRAVLAGGFASLAAMVAMPVAGAAITGTGSWWLPPAAAVALAAGAAVVLAARRGSIAARWLAGHAHGGRLVAGLAAMARQRLGPRPGAAVAVASALSALAEAGLLAAAFEVAETPVPWRGLLLACAARPAHGRRHPPRRPRGQPRLPPRPQNVTAMPARPGKHAPAPGPGRPSLVQQLGRRGADRTGGRQPGRHRPAAAGPPLTTRTASRREIRTSADPQLRSML